MPTDPEQDDLRLGLDGQVIRRKRRSRTDSTPAPEPAEAAAVPDREQAEVRLDLEGNVVRRKRRSREEAPASDPEPQGPASAAGQRCPRCGCGEATRLRRSIWAKLLCRKEIRRCLECDTRFWSLDVDRARTTALVSTAFAFMFIIVFAIVQYGPTRAVPVPPPVPYSSLAPHRTNRLALSPAQNRALMRRIQGKGDDPLTSPPPGR